VNDIFCSIIHKFPGATDGRVAIFIILSLFCMLSLGACGSDTAVPATPTSGPAASGATPAPTGGAGTGSGIVAQGVSGSQPLPTPTPPSVTNRTVLSIWTGGWKGNADYEKFLNGQIDNYRNRNPRVTVDWQDFGGDLAQKFEEAASNPTKNPPPDIVLFKAGELYQFGAKGYLADLGQLGGTTLKDDYVASTFEGLRVGSTYYGLPWLASTQVTIINKKLWQQATLDPAKPPKTFAELDTMLPLMITKTGQDVTSAWFKPDVLGEFLMEDVPLYTVSGDGSTRQAAFPSPGTIEKWQYFQTKRKQGAFAKDALLKDYPDALKKYTANQLVMVMDGAPLLPALKNASPDLYKDTLVVPHIVGKANLLPMDLQGWAIPKASHQSQDALAFLKFLNSADNQLAFAKLSGLVVPTQKKALTDPFITGQDDLQTQARSIMAQSLNQAKPAESLLPTPLTPADREKLLAALNKGLNTIWTTDTSPQAALQEAAKAWKEVLK
jgi:ABC-type glycerol-3-phosphate transport system substrate-binding protein